MFELEYDFNIHYLLSSHKRKKKKTTVTTKDKRRVKYVGAYVGCMANTDEAQISSAG